MSNISQPGHTNRDDIPKNSDRSAPMQELSELFGERFVTNQADCRQHASTLTWHPTQAPDAVVYPHTTQEVVQIVNVARTHNWPLIPFGAGTSLEGHLNAPHGGISIDMSHMDAIKSVSTGDLDCTIEPGVTRGALNEHLRDTGLFFPIDPGTEEATLGGMAATRASGTCAVRYGTMRENVVRVEAVMADGSIVNTGSRARKSAAGYDLTRLLVGSEGTLGIITELTLKLYGIPESVIAAVVPFKSLHGACEAVMSAMALGLNVARIEILDALQIEIINDKSGLNLDAAPTLFLEFHGTPGSTKEQVSIFEEIARESGAQSFDWAENQDERRKLWKARHHAFWSVREAYPGKAILVTDVCVPVSRLAECMEQTDNDKRAAGIIAPIIGHVGDGNFHAICVVDPENIGEMHALKGFTERLALRAISMGGTCTGEHGIGQGKMDFLVKELGSGIDVLRAIKKALDPTNILNPGKIIDFGN